MLSILCEIDFKEADDFRHTKLYQNLLDNDHLNVLSNISFFDEFITFSKQLYGESLDLENQMSELKKFVSAKINESDRNEILSLAISSLQSFAWINWLGPVPVQFSTLSSEIKKLDLKNPVDTLKVFNLIESFELNSQVYYKKILIVD